MQAPFPTHLLLLPAHFASIFAGGADGRLVRNIEQQAPNAHGLYREALDSFLKGYRLIQKGETGPQIESILHDTTESLWTVSACGTNLLDPEDFLVMSSAIYLTGKLCLRQIEIHQKSLELQTKNLLLATAHLTKPNQKRLWQADPSETFTSQALLSASIMMLMGTIDPDRIIPWARDSLSNFLGRMGAIA